MAAKPTPPSQLYSFTNHSQSFPNTPQPGDRLDSEFASLRNFANQVTQWVDTALANDGTIKPGVIGTVNLDPALVQGIVDDVEAEVQPLVTAAQSAAGTATTQANAASVSASGASASMSQAQGYASTASAKAGDATTAANTAQGHASTASGHAATATSKASEAEGYRTTALDKRNDAIMFSEYMAGPVWTSAQYAAIDPGELPPGFAYQPVDGLPAGLHSAKWWAVQAMQIVENGDLLPSAGGTMTGALVLYGNPVGSLEAAPKQYVDARVLKAGDTMAGFLTLHSSSPTNPLHAASKGYVDTALVAAVGGSYLPLSGGTLTGFITQHTDYPSADRHLATKKYVDTMVVSGGLNPAVYVAKAGDAMGGVLTHTDGSVTVPSIAFTNDANTGLYLAGTDSVGVAGGNARIALLQQGLLEMAGAANADASMALQVYGTGNAARFAGYAAAGTLAAPTAVTAKALATLDGVGYDGSAWKTAARVVLGAGETFGAAANGTYVAVSTTSNGSTTLAERLRVLGSGNVLVGATTDLDAGHRLQVAGSVLSQGTSATVAARATGSTGLALVSAQAGDYASLPSYESANLAYYEASSTVQQCGITLADWGVVSFVGTNGGMVFNAASVPLVFGTANAERLRIGGTGRVMVGTTTDNGTDLLQVSGTAVVTAPAGGANNTQVPTTAWVRTLAAGYQPLDADLTAIAALGATAGFLKKTGADAWTIDTNSYALSSHNHDATYQPLDADLTALAGLTRAKGALVVGGSAAWAAESVGANDTLLVADSTQTNGVKWTASPVVTNLKINGHAYFDEVVDNGNSGASMTINWQNGNKQKVTLSANCALSFTNPLGPCEGKLLIVQPSSGGPYTPTLPTMKKLDGANFQWSTAANAIDVLAWFYDGTNYYGTVAAFS